MGLINQEDANDQKPLAAKWFKLAGKDAVTKVTKIKLSSSGDWIIIECQHCVALLNAASKAGKDFWAFAIQLEGTLKVLELSYAKGKLGWDLNPGTETAEWTVDLDDEIILNSLHDDFSVGGNNGKGTFTQLTLEAMAASPAASNPSSRRRTGTK